MSKAVDKQLGFLPASGKSAGKKLGSSIADGVRASESDVKRAFDNHAKLADKAADSTGRLKVAQAGYQDLVDKGVRSGQRYERAKAAVEKATRDEVRATRSATDALKDYEKAQKSAADGVDKIGSGFGAKLKSFAGDAASGGAEAASGFVEGFGGPIAEIGSKAGPIGVALTAAAALAVGAGALIAKQVMAGMDRELTADRFQAQLGLSDSEAAAFGQSAGEVYAGAFGESLGDVQEAMADVASTLGKSSGASIEDMTAKALTFRDVFGTETAESIATAQNLIVNGLAKNAGDAFDKMVVAYQRVPAAMRGELPEILQEYSTFAGSLGLSSEEVFGLIVKNAGRGKIAIDKIGDALKEFTLRATDVEAKPVQDVMAALGLSGQEVANNLLAGGERAGAQLDQVIDKLLGIQDPAAQAAAAVTLFGTPLEDLDKAKIPAFLAGLDNAETAMDGFAGAADRMVATVGDNAATSVESAKRAIDTGVAAMQTGLADAFGPMIEQIAGWLVENQDSITAFFTTTANAAAEFGAAVGAAVAGVVYTLGRLAQGIGEAAGFVVDGFESMVGAAATVADAVGMDGLASDLRDAQQELGSVSDDLRGAGDGLMDFGGSLFDASMKLHDFDANMGSTQTSAQNAAAQIENVRNQVAALPNGHQIGIDAIVVFKDQAGRAIDPAQLLGYNPAEFASAGDAQRARRGLPYNTAGPVTPSVASTTPRPVTPYTIPSGGGSSGGGGGGGGGTSAAPTYFDPSQWKYGSYPGDAALLANVPAGRYDASGDLVRGLGDCTSAVEDLVALWDGRTTAGRSLSTGNADQWLTAHGFLPGMGGPGDFRVGFNAGHMQATLPDGTPFNWGSDAAAARGGVGGTGAFDPSFTSHYYRPAAGPAAGMPNAAITNAAIPVAASGGWEIDQQAIFDAESNVIKDQQELEEKRLKLLELKADGNAKQSQIIAAENDIEQQKRDLESSQMKLAKAKQGKYREAAQSGSRSRGGSGGFSAPSSLSGFGQSFGSAAGAFLDGQVASALDVFGAGESPGWLKGISTFVNGLSFSGPGGGGLFGGAAPVSATPGLSSAPDLGDVAHGGRAGQAPGPTYNIRTATVEDAFLAAQRKENERSLAKLSSS